LRHFAALFDDLDRTNSTNAKVERLEHYFRSVPPGDAAWALALLLGKRRRRLISGRRLREICQEATALPDWLFEACHSQVGDSAETVALLWPHPAPQATNEADALETWMAERLPQLAALEPTAQAEAVRHCWATLTASALLLVPSSC